MPAKKRAQDEETRRTARRLGIPEHDVAQPDAVIDLGYRVELKDDVHFDKTPLQPHHVSPPPELGDEPWERYPLERDRAPVMEEVPLETDVALGLDEDIHHEPEPEHRMNKRRDRRGTA